jgi:hypothetical protein
MKKILFATLLVGSVSAAFSQGNINKGDWMLGGNAGFNSSKIEDIDASKTTTVSVSPNVGYFFINNLAGGLRASFTSQKQKDVDAEHELSVAPFVRYYFLPSSQKVNVFLDGTYGFGSAKFNTIGGSATESFNQFGITGGAAIFLTPTAALEFGLGYTSAGGDFYGDKRHNNIGLNIGFQIHLSGTVKK